MKNQWYNDTFYNISVTHLFLLKWKKKGFINPKIKIFLACWVKVADKSLSYSLLSFAKKVRTVTVPVSNLAK